MIACTNLMVECPLFPLFLVAAILFGLAVGSFSGCMSYRIAHEWQLFKPSGSHCPSCKKALRWYENIPLLSFILQRGTCRGCAAKLSIIYPIAELSYALWSAFLFWRYGLTVEYGVFMAIGLVLLLISMVDLEAYFIPDLFVTVGCVLAAGASIMGIGVGIKDAALGAAVGAGIMQALRLIYMRMRQEEGMGYGDVKLLLFLGLCVGLLGLAYVLLMASVLAIVCTLIAKWGSVDRSTRLPFGPYLCAGCALYMLFHSAILQFFGFTS